MNDLDDLEGEDFADSDQVDGTPETYHAEDSTSPVNVTTFVEEYDYDVETNLNSFFWDELLPTLIVYSLTFILGLVGNILIIFTTFRYRKMKSTTNVFLASLASADLLLIVFCIPVKESAVSPSGRENPPVNLESPRELSKSLALCNLRKSLREKNETIVNGLESRNDCLTNLLVKEPPESFELEELMLKLKQALKNCTEVLKPEEMRFLDEVRISELVTRDESPERRILPDVHSTIAYPVSMGRNNRIGGSYRTVQGCELKSFPYDRVGRYPPESTNGFKRKKNAQNWWLNNMRGVGPIVMSSVMNRMESDSEVDYVPNVDEDSDEFIPGSEYGKSGSRKKDSGRSEPNHRSIVNSSEGKEGLSPEKAESRRRIERKIQKLDSKLKEILRRVGVYPPKDQVAIKKCLQKLRETSEAVLRRIGTDRFGSCHRYHSSSGCRSDDGSAVRATSDKHIILKTSESEVQLNVGMEITMENFDPVTGKKILPEQNRDFEQQGNIKCKLVKSGESPVTFLDTDFMYNPKTGMLFQTGQKGSRNNKSGKVVKPAAKAYLMDKSSKRGYNREDDEFDAFDNKSGMARNTENIRFVTYGDRDSSPETSKSMTEDAFSLAIEREERKNAKRLREGRNTSRSFPGEKPRFTGKESRRRRVSITPILSNSQNQGGGHASGYSEVKDKRKGNMYNFRIKLAKLFSYTWTFGFFICKLVYYMQSVSAICSVLTLTAMSVERYYAIVHPMRAQYVCTISQARRIITFTWVSAIFLAIPVLFAQIHMPVGVRVKGFWCVRDYDNPTIWRAHETYMLLLILIIPTGVMGVAYTTICFEIWQVMQRRQDLTSAKILNIRYNKASVNSDSFRAYGKEKKQQRNAYGESPDDEAHVKQVIKMLVAVVVIYVVCWAPLLIDNILQAYGVVPFMKFGKQKYLATAFHLMAYFNSCINPIIYGFMSKNFRESFRKTLCCKTRKGHTSMRNTSLSHDRSTSIRYAESRFVRKLTGSCLSLSVNYHSIRERSSRDERRFQSEKSTSGGNTFDELHIRDSYLKSNGNVCRLSIEDKPKSSTLQFWTDRFNYDA